MKQRIIDLTIGLSITGLCLWGIWKIIVYASEHQVQPLTNDQVITETKKCEDAGLRAITYPHSLNIEKIICIPKIDSTTTQNIKKSNITNVTVEK